MTTGTPDTYYLTGADVARELGIEPASVRNFGRKHPHLGQLVKITPSLTRRMYSDADLIYMASISTGRRGRPRKAKP